MYEIERSGYKNKLIGGIVLTGGGSMLKNIEELVEYHTGIHTKVSYPIEHLAHGYVKDLSSPVFSTSIGLLLNGLENRKYAQAIEMEEEKEEVFVQKAEPVHTAKISTKRHKDESAADIDDYDDTPTDREHAHRQARDPDAPTFWNRMFHKTKDWFEAGPDSDLN